MLGIWERIRFGREQHVCAESHSCQQCWPCIRIPRTMVALFIERENDKFISPMNHFVIPLLVEIEFNKITYEWLDKCCPYSSREGRFHWRRL